MLSRMVPSSPPAMRTLHLLKTPDILCANDSRPTVSYWLSNPAKDCESRSTASFGATPQIDCFSPADGISNGKRECRSQKPSDRPLLVARSRPEPANCPSPAAPAFLSTLQPPKREPQTHPNRLPFPSLIHSQIFLPKFADHYACLAHNNPMIAIPRIVGSRLFAACLQACAKGHDRGGKNNVRKNLGCFA